MVYEKDRDVSIFRFLSIGQLKKFAIKMQNFLNNNNNFNLSFKI